MAKRAVVRQFGDLEKLSLSAARDLMALAERSLNLGPRFTVALAGGSTPRRMYEMIALAPERDRVDWNAVHFFFGDERCVPPDHAESNFRMAHEALFEPLGLPEANVFRMHGEAADPTSAADDYAEAMAKFFGMPVNDAPPAIDLVLLGLGTDGHTASLFPDTTALDSRKWIEANFVPKFSAHRLTMTARVLNAAKNVAFLTAGMDKAAALAAVIDGPPNPRQYPAQLIQPAESVVWYVDRLAASKLKGRLDTETAEVPVEGPDWHDLIAQR